MPLEVVLGAAIVLSLTLYALTGGADFGTGVWYLLASGPRAQAQRDVISAALGPIWEANHVWLIVAVTVLFTVFPHAFSLMTTVLHIPLTLLLLGIVMRGSTFIFRTKDVKETHYHRWWDQVFIGSSLMAPLLLGITIGAIASGETHIRTGSFVEIFVDPWLAPFPVAVGLVTLALFAFLAAVYLTLEPADVELQEDFRARGLVAGGVVAALCGLVLFLASSGAPHLYRDLTESWWQGPLLALGAFTAGTALIALWKRRYALARVAAAAVTVVIIWGWAWSQFPYVIEPDITLYDAAAPQAILRFMVGILVGGACLVLPSLYYLFRIFKGGVVSPDR